MSVLYWSLVPPAPTFGAYVESFLENQHTCTIVCLLLVASNISQLVKDQI